MRIWHIPYTYLDGQRLLSQHNEIHGLSTVILKGGQWGSISNEFKHSVDYMVMIHERCVQEMDDRKRTKGQIVCDHNSPFHSLSSLKEEHRSHKYHPTQEQLTTDVKQLRDKWEAEGYYFGTGRAELNELELLYNLPLGPDKLQAEFRKEETRELVKKHKVALSKMGDKRLGQKLTLLKEQL